MKQHHSEYTESNIRDFLSGMIEGTASIENDQKWLGKLEDDLAKLTTHISNLKKQIAAKELAKTRGWSWAMIDDEANDYYVFIGTDSEIQESLSK